MNVHIYCLFLRNVRSLCQGTGINRSFPALDHDLLEYCGNSGIQLSQLFLQPYNHTVHMTALREVGTDGVHALPGASTSMWLFLVADLELFWCF